MPLAGNLPSEVQTLAAVERLAMDSLPPGWSLRATRRPPRGREPDAVWNIQAPDGSVASFAVEVKRALLGRQLVDVLSQLATFEGLPLVAAAYLSPTLRASLVDRGVPPGTLDDDDARFDEGLIASVRAGSLVAGVLAIRLEDEE